MRRLEVLTLVAIVALAAWLRLSHLDLIEYKADEAVAVDLTLPLIEGREVPRAGLVSSVGMRNPPMLMYLLAPPLLVDADPITASGFVAILSTLAVVSTYLVMRPRFGAFVALTAAALFATAPWAVLFGRKIWAQDFLPIFSAALLHCLFAIVERPRTWLVLWVPVLVCALWQLHFSAFAVLPIAGIVVLYAARQLHRTAFALGVVLAATMLVPYLQHQVGEGWNDFKILRSLAARPGDRKPPLDIRPVLYTADISGADGWAFVMGDSDRAFSNRARSARRAADVASAFSRIFLLGGLVMLVAGLLWRASQRGAAWRRLHAEDERHAALLLWVGGIWATFIVARLDALYPHYFVLTYPAPFVIVALALDRCRDLGARWRPAPALAAAIVTVVAMCAAYVSFNTAFIRFVDRQGGTSGDYGVAYRHKDDIATFALRHHLELKEAPPEVDQLVALRRRYPRPEAGPVEVVPPGRSLEIRDWARQGDFPECASDRRRQFGPLVACIRP